LDFHVCPGAPGSDFVRRVLVAQDRPS
jgi:hypothetical protein